MCLGTLRAPADVAELVDAHGSGPCGRKLVEVQVLSSAFLAMKLRPQADFIALADGSGPCGRKLVEVQVLSSALKLARCCLRLSRVGYSSNIQGGGDE